ncbi:MAG: hypothetical protein HOO93_10545 [Methyloglobulus sp.]|nr:hypothetical protein [Methyloglobulus sp.]
MTLLIYTLAFMAAGLMLLAIARRPVMLQAMQPALTDMVSHFNSRRAKHAYHGFYLLFRAVAKLFLLLLSGVLVILAIRSDDEDTERTEGRWHGGCLWYRDITGAWYSYSADDDTPSPPLF